MEGDHKGRPYSHPRRGSPCGCLTHYADDGKELCHWNGLTLNT